MFNPQKADEAQAKLDKANKAFEELKELKAGLPEAERNEKIWGNMVQKQECTFAQYKEKLDILNSLKELIKNQKETSDTLAGEYHQFIRDNQIEEG